MVIEHGLLGNLSFIHTYEYRDIYIYIHDFSIKKNNSIDRGLSKPDMIDDTGRYIPSNILLNMPVSTVVKPL